MNRALTLLLGFLIVFVIAAVAIYLVDAFIPMTASVRSIFHLGLVVVIVLGMLFWGKDMISKSGTP